MGPAAGLESVSVKIRKRAARPPNLNSTAIESIEDKIPDHSVFSRARHERFRESEVFRGVFERVVASCIAVGLVGGEAFSIDASLINADVDQRKRMPGDEAINWPKPEEASRAVAEYLAALDEAHHVTEDTAITIASRRNRSR